MFYRFFNNAIKIFYPVSGALFCAVYKNGFALREPMIALPKPGRDLSRLQTIVDYKSKIVSLNNLKFYQGLKL